MRAQFANRRNKLVCSECGGYSFSDPTKEYHWAKCSRYAAWRFRPAERYYTVKEQVLHDRALRSVGHGCTCHDDPTKPLCDYCSWHIDNSDEGGV